MAKVTGLGGVFFRCDDPSGIRDWYRKHLGIESEEYGFPFMWRELDRPEKRGYSVWNPFPQETKHFDPSSKQFMINYRVENLTELMRRFVAAGVEIAGEMVEAENGKFAWILDPEGNKIELWEPIDSDVDPYLPQEAEEADD